MENVNKLKKGWCILLSILLIISTLAMAQAIAVDDNTEKDSLSVAGETKSKDDPEKNRAIIWNCNLSFNELGGKFSSAVFGEASDACSCMV